MRCTGRRPPPRELAEWLRMWKGREADVEAAYREAEVEAAYRQAVAAREPATRS
jgi:hypothetical protein